MVIANADLLRQIVHNYKRMNTRRIVFKFGITYNTPTEKVKEVAALVKRIIEGIEVAKFDRAHFLGFDDSQLTFEVVYIMQVSDYNRYMDTQQAINLALLEGLREMDVQFAFPTRSVEFIGGRLPEVSVAGVPQEKAANQPAGNAESQPRDPAQHLMNHPPQADGLRRHRVHARSAARAYAEDGSISPIKRQDS